LKLLQNNRKKSFLITEADNLTKSLQPTAERHHSRQKGTFQQINRRICKKLVVARVSATAYYKTNYSSALELSESIF